MRPTDPVLGSISTNAVQVEALLHSAFLGEHVSLEGEDDIGSWSIAARPADGSAIIVSFEFANNTAIWEGALADIDGNLTLWGEFRSQASPGTALSELGLIEAEAHRLAYLVGEEE